MMLYYFIDTERFPKRKIKCSKALVGSFSSKKTSMRSVNSVPQPNGLIAQLKCMVTVLFVSHFDVVTCSFDIDAAKSHPGLITVEWNGHILELGDDSCLVEWGTADETGPCSILIVGKGMALTAASASP